MQNLRRCVSPDLTFQKGCRQLESPDRLGEDLPPDCRQEPNEGIEQVRGCDGCNCAVVNGSCMPVAASAHGCVNLDALRLLKCCVLCNKLRTL